MTSYRLPTGGLVDRDSALPFRFDGAPLQGFGGDTLASALLANGRRLVGRSFKHHRPRGVLTAGSAEPNALVTVGSGGRTEPNTRATVQELYAGLEARSQNRWPSLAFDMGAVNGLLSPFLAAGFYYKTFMWPAAFWERVYEPLIRRAAGLGRASHAADPDAYEKRWAHCDLLVVGAGIAGLAAALVAARAGARVIVADEGDRPGGDLLAASATLDGADAHAWVGSVLRELEACPEVQVLPRTTVFGWYDGGVFGAVERVQKHVAAPDPRLPVERLWRIAARRAILATGALERPLCFGGNDVPGVMTAGAMRVFLNRYAVAPGRRAAVFTTNDSGYALAADLERAGVEVAAVVDSRPEAPSFPGLKARVIPDAAISDAHGGRSIRAVDIWRDGTRERLAVDALAMAGGFDPVIHLACQRGGKPRWSDAHGAFLAPDARDGLAPAGAAAGVSGLAACFASGASRAAEAVAELGFRPAALTPPTVEGDVVAPPAAPLWTVRGVRGKAYVDFQNDVRRDDLGLAVREGYGHVELAKRYTTNGMATDQGKLSNVVAIGLLAEARGVSPGEVGTTTFRPFYTPVSFGALAGPHHGEAFQPLRLSPLHDWAARRGAVFVDSGLWRRASWFPRPGETSWRDSVDREVLNVRAHVGVCDVSTLGKIEICGPDAAAFLDRVYCNGFRKLPVGKARYGLMLREDGFIDDDGTTSRLSENRYVMTTTTAHAAKVLGHLEFCAQALWPDLDVRLASVSDQWAQMAVAGPRSRDLLQRVVDEDLSNAAFPYLAARDVSLFGGRLRGRLFRISFSGELAYELAVPADFGDGVAEALMQAGEAYGVQPYGVEAMGVLRIEKGHVTHNEINGTVTPADLGLGRMVSDKPDFIGRRMLNREALVAAGRPQLVGVAPLDPRESFRTGSHILAKGADATLENDQGYVTSTAFSPHVGSAIGLALVTDGASRHGEEVLVWNGLRGEFTPARLVSPVFVDPANEKLHA